MMLFMLIHNRIQIRIHASKFSYSVHHLMFFQRSRQRIMVRKARDLVEEVEDVMPAGDDENEAMPAGVDEVKVVENVDELEFSTHAVVLPPNHSDVPTEDNAKPG